MLEDIEVENIDKGETCVVEERFAVGVTWTPLLLKSSGEVAVGVTWTPLLLKSGGEVDNESTLEAWLAVAERECGVGFKVVGMVVMVRKECAVVPWKSLLYRAGWVLLALLLLLLLWMGKVELTLVVPPDWSCLFALWTSGMVIPNTAPITRTAVNPTTTKMITTILGLWYVRPCSVPTWVTLLATPLSSSNSSSKDGSKGTVSSSAISINDYSDDKSTSPSNSSSAIVTGDALFTFLCPTIFMNRVTENPAQSLLRPAWLGGRIGKKLTPPTVGATF